MAGIDLTGLIPLAGGAVGVPLTFWRLWVYVDRVRSAQLKAETAARIDAETKLAAAEADEDVERHLRQVAEQAASLAVARNAGQEETIRYLTAQLARTTTGGAA